MVLDRKFFNHREVERVALMTGGVGELTSNSSKEEERRMNETGQ